MDGRAGEINTGLEKWPLQKSNEDLLDLLLLDKKFHLTKNLQVKNADLMWKQSVWSSAIAASLASR